MQVLYQKQVKCHCYGLIKKRLLIYRRLFSVVQCDTMFYLLSVLKLRYFLKRVKDL